MKLIAYGLIPGILIFSGLVSADTYETLAQGKSQIINRNAETITIISNNGEIVSLDAKKILETIAPFSGGADLTKLEIFVHDELDDILISNRERLHILTNIDELKQCCPNLRSVVDSRLNDIQIK